MHITKIYGPPGTGKTTKLLEIYKNELRNGANPKRIAFISHTKSAIKEGKTRVLKDLFNEGFQFSTDDFYYWRTMHSMAYISLGTKPEIVNLTKNFNKEQRSLLSLMVANFDKYKESLAHPFTEITPTQIGAVFDQYMKELANPNKIDFSGMLLKALYNGKSFDDLDVVLIDEAQDFSSIQFALADKLFKNCSRIYYAGDDDQAIYSGLGADETYFINLKADEEICLEKSYRLPESVHKIAINVINNIKDRAPKTFTHNGASGRVKKFTPLVDIESLRQTILNFCKENKSILILALSKLELSRIAKPLIKSGINVNIGGKINPNWTKSKFDWAEKYSTFCKATNHFSYSTWNKLYPEFKLEADSINEQILAWTEFCMYNNINLESKIDALTVHAAKGKEADIVIFYESLPRAFGNNLDEYNKALYRLLYVAVTRAKEALYFLPNFFDLSKSLDMRNVVNRGKSIKGE